MTTPSREEFIAYTMQRVAQNERNARAASGIVEPRVPTKEEREKAEWDAGAAERELQAAHLARFGKKHESTVTGRSIIEPQQVAPARVYKNSHMVEVFGNFILAEALIEPIVDTPEGLALVREILDYIDAGE